MRAFMRAISRSNLPVWYTEGFNPRIHLSFSTSLSLGYEGLEESFSIFLLEEIEPEQVKARINQYLPEELSIVHVQPPVERATAIAWSDYQLELYYDAPLSDTKKALGEFFQQTKFPATKRTKGREHPVDIKPAIKNESIALMEDCVQVCFRIATGTAYNVNPRLFAQSFSSFYGKEPVHVAYTRVAFFDSSEKPFR